MAAVVLVKMIQKKRVLEKNKEQDVHKIRKGIQTKHNLHYNERACIMEHMNNHTDTHTTHTHTCGWEGGHTRVYIHMHEMNEAM